MFFFIFLEIVQIRRRSPAEIYGLREGDHVLAINGFDALDMSHSRAVQIIDSAAYTLELIVGRYERQQRMETIYLDNEALRSKQIPQELTTTELQLFWEKEMPLRPQRSKVPPPERKPIVIPAPKPVPIRTMQVLVPSPAPPPPKPQPTVFYVAPPQRKPSPPPPAPPPPPPPPPHSTEKVIVPQDPEVTSVSVRKLMKEFDVPPIAPELRKKNYADSSFYSDPNKYYPTIEEQIEMARKVADSLQDPENLFSKGVNMFEKQRLRADKHVREGPEPEPDPIEQATKEDLEHMIPPVPPPPPPPPPPSFPGLQPVNKQTYPIPPPPPLLPGQPKTVQEFLEKIKVFPTSSHADMDPQKCFDIASALYTSDSRGAKMFAKRHARAKRWDAEATDGGDGPVRLRSPAPMQQPMMAAAPGPTVHDQLKSKLASRLPAKKTQDNYPAAQGQVNRSMAQMKPMQPLQRMDSAPAKTPGSISLAANHESSPPKPAPALAEAMPKPFGQMDSALQASSSSLIGNLASAYGSSTTSLSSATSESGSQSGWRPVKFKIAAAAAPVEQTQKEHSATPEPELRPRARPESESEVESLSEPKTEANPIPDEVPEPPKTDTKENVDEPAKEEDSSATETPVASDAEEEKE
ncbi:unnamed protein product [Echinostoma caproni]|uniref:PDZ domain-containing protein n=1 Tax=Echinostoma caproni TaxID=27848 RepID=A0A3P8FBY5_9TREM|nr:unnamed protein product [Echinostoma caproni]